MNTKIIRLQPKDNSKTVVARSRVCVRAAGLVLVLMLLLSPQLALAAVQGYSVQDKTIVTGMAVALAGSGGTDGIQKSSVAHADKTLGVVVNQQDNTVAVSSDGPSQVYVATTGTATVFVSDVNDPVRKGDLLAPSPIAGVLMRANEGTKGVLGVALADFPTKDVQKVSIKGQNGQPTEAKVALVGVNMDVKFAANNAPTGKSWFQRVGESLVGHEVSSTQVIVSLIILLLLVVVEGAMVYGAISSSVISLGRNPLAKKTILRGLTQISALVAVVLALGLAAIYLVLWI